MKTKIYKNALICEKLVKLSAEDKKKIVNNLLKRSSLRKLSEDLGIPHSTLHLWTMDKKEPELYNFNTFYHKIKNMKPNEVSDWGRVEQIRDILNKLLMSNRTLKV